ncbi:glycine dehydrogenase [Baffinella frigidus]|nr:glycine dehydrogenase [Cryptophyta sp. CCMP2293]
MLKVCNAASMEVLMNETVPESIRNRPKMKVGEALTETEALEKLYNQVKKNKMHKTFIGMGYYNTITPPPILRNIIQNPGWYTPYTPYQAEISQGRMESLVNYQTMVADLTGMPIAQSSLLDEATAAAEGMAMSQTIHKSKRAKFFVSSLCNPQTIELCEVRAEPMGIEVIVMSIFVADLLSLTMLTPPGDIGADIVLGNSQRFGVPLGYGGPHAAFLACQDAHKRAVPGRIIGLSRDANGDKAPARKSAATRQPTAAKPRPPLNLDPPQALLANTAAFYGIYHGPDGLKKIAERVNGLAKTFAAGLKGAGIKVSDMPFFDTVRINDVDAPALMKAAIAAEMNLRMYDAKTITVAFDETAGPADVVKLLGVFGVKTVDFDALSATVTPGFSGSLHRTSEYMTAEVFHKFRTETELMRYMFHLQSKDYGLNTGMIPLGSCTMKLNSASEMIPVTWPEINSIHPFVPVDQVPGYHEMLTELGDWLIDITGFDAISLQPNAGASGEYAGLMAIRAYHLDRKDDHRNICLIPRAAHGTNPATAAMCGMDVVPIECDDQGNTDMQDLKDKIEEHKNNLGALMITYPSTHGVFEETIVEICQRIHDAGGLVYMDGANMNAQVGYCSPGHIGADVCHLNLHKTFCIPHGGGGPGMGPIGVVKRLEPFLPGHSVIATGGAHRASEGGKKSIKAIAAAPWGSASILPISWMYIQMMGTTGLERATELAILNANYMKDRLKGQFETLFISSTGRVAHEFILDLRPFKESCGVDATDIAKRLIDYSMHAPTMSWPVAGTLMCEPTESESKEELDRFCDALLAIREEIREIESGKYDKHDNLLKNAPHTMAEISAAEWNHKYSRDQAAFPLEGLRSNKFWPSIKRIDDVYGDKNLVIILEKNQKLNVRVKLN